jgi:hypothetical protein
MVSLMAWVRSKFQTMVEDIWCVRCHAHRTVKEIIVVSHPRGKRMVGECRDCGGRTSTFVSRGT